MKIDIIGGGVAGCGAGVDLANAGHQVTIWESLDNLLDGSSDATPCRLSLGLHYKDKETAIQCLHDTIGIVRKYPGFKLIDRESYAVDPPQYLQRSRYFIMKDSFYTPEEILKLYEELREEYTRLIKEDPENQVFGPPEKFIQKLNPELYKKDIDMTKVEVGLETAECSLDWPRFKEYLIQTVINHPNICVHTNMKIVDAKVCQNTIDPKFSLTIKNTKSGEQALINTDFVINASWQNIESINQKAGFISTSIRTNRTKVMIKVRLPEVLKDAPSSFLCFGAYGSVTNFGIDENTGEHVGFITYEPITNIEYNTTLEVSPLSARLLSGQATLEEKQDYGKKIIEGVSQYIPAMKDATFIEAKFGNVRTEGSVDIYSPLSQSNIRREDGIKEQQIGWVDNSSPKLLRFVNNAKKIINLVCQHEKALANIKSIAINEIQKSVKFENIKSITPMFTKYLQRYIDSSQLANEEKLHDLTTELIKTAKAKKKINSTSLSTYRIMKLS